jgi:TorA maturation chaperone TorD/DNA-binding transcriptional regulator YdaS (Cro superfamily)
VSEALTRAIEIVGGQTQLARLLGLKQANVWHWLKRAEHVPGEYVLAIERATGGQVSRHDLRHDLYPKASDAPSAIVEEDIWRSQIYALLGRCFARRPDQALLTALAQLRGDATALGEAFKQIAAEARRMTLAQVQDEYDALFIGLARGELLPYASYYRTGFLNERPLAKLRGDMAKLGFAAADKVAEPEDHIGGLCEMMALLITRPADLKDQERFFKEHLAPWAERFFADLEGAEHAGLYRPIGTAGRLFMTIETEAFALAA